MLTQELPHTPLRATGKIVHVAHGETAAGAHDFVWDGHNNAGTQLPDGACRLTVTAVGADGKTAACPVESQGVVSEVDLAGAEPILMIGSRGVPHGVTQFDAASAMTTAGVNGAPLGALAGIAIDDEGFVTALFDNGIQQDDMMQELMRIKQRGKRRRRR